MTCKNLLTIIFLLSSLNFAMSQASLKINEAELLICQNKYDEAAEIYDYLLNQKEALLSPDYYNAALCHIKSDNFQAAKKHLNKLAQMGINPGELLVHANLANSNDWESYMITYNQFYDYAEKNNKYTRFEHEMTELKSKIEELEDRMRIHFRSNGSHINSYTADVIFDKEVVHVVKRYTSNKRRFFETFDMSRDSIMRTEKYLNFKSEVKELKAQYFTDFVTFVNENSWPMESELNQVSIDQETNSFLQMAAYFFRAGPTSVVNYLGKETITIQYSSRLDSFNLNFFVSKIQKSLNAACEDGKIKSSTVLKIFYPEVYKDYSDVKAISIFVNEAGCNEFGDKIYFEPVQLKTFDKTLPPNLESREDLGKKYLFMIKNPGLFILGVQAQIEEAHYGSCESARQYIKSKKLFTLN
jgi:hypothetical protein